MGSACSTQGRYLEEYESRTADNVTHITAPLESRDLHNDQPIEVDSDDIKNSQRLSYKSRAQLNVIITEKSVNSSANASPASNGVAGATQLGFKDTDPGSRSARFFAKKSSLSIGGFTIDEKGLQGGALEECPCTFLSNGRSDFVMIDKLGTGTSLRRSLYDLSSSHLPSFALPSPSVSQVPLAVCSRPSTPPP